MRFVLGSVAAVISLTLACSNTTPQNASDGAVGGGDGGASYAAWWSYPECQTADGSCPPDTCIPNSIVVVTDRCGPYQQLEVGCVTKITPVASWYCVMHESSSDLLFTLYPPKGGGFVACQGEGIPSAGLPAEGSLCPDAAAN